MNDIQRKDMLMWERRCSQNFASLQYFTLFKMHSCFLKCTVPSLFAVGTAAMKSEITTPCLSLIWILLLCLGFGHWGKTDSDYFVKRVRFQDECIFELISYNRKQQNILFLKDKNNFAGFKITLLKSSDSTYPEPQVKTYRKSIWA